jgi:hypothetical protein
VEPRLQESKQDMSKKKSSSKSRKSAADVSETIFDEEKSTGSSKKDRKDLRREPPVARLRAMMNLLATKLDTSLAKLVSWQPATANEDLGEAVTCLGGIVNEMHVLDEHLDALEESGFSPARKSFTSQAEEGDHVSVLEASRDKYTDIMEPSNMVDMTVVKKQPGKGGGLIVEAEDGSRMKVATSHVVRTLPRAA